MSGSFIQSHWPCITLWPISMFSRIFASDSAAVPASHSGLLARAEQQRARGEHELAVQPDRRADVARVALAEVGVHLVVDRVELAAQLLELLGGEARERALAAPGRLELARGGVGRAARAGGCARRARCAVAARVRLGSRGCSELDLDRALGRVDAGLQQLAGLAVHAAGAQVAHLSASAAARRSCGRCPCDSRTAASRRRARRPARIGCSPSLRASTPLGAEVDRAAARRARRRRRRSSGWKRSTCSRAGSPSRAPVLARAPRAGRRARTGTSRARASRGTARRARAGARRPCSPVSRSVQPVAALAARPARAARARRSPPSASRAQWTWTTSRSVASRRARLRSMLMIGVMPLPALTNSSRAGSGSGSTKVPSTPPSRTIAPGRRRVHRYGETLPPRHQLRRDRDAAVARARGRR